MTPERNGLVFCTDRAGTGINRVIANSHDYYCGDATLGNCQSQIVVNDRYGSGGGGSTARQTSSGAPPDQAVPAPEVVAQPAREDDDTLDEAEQAAVDSQVGAGLSLDLAASDGRTIEIVSGEAVLVDLHVSQLSPDALVAGADDEPEAKRIEKLGGDKKPWTEQVRFLLLDEAGKLAPAPLKLAPIGKVVQAGKAGTKAHDAPQLDLQADQVYTASFAAGGAATARLSPGKYRLFAAVALSGPELPPQVRSSSIVVTVKGEADLPDDERQQVAARRQLSEARLAYRAERFAECEKLCTAAVSQVPELCDARLLLAQSLHRQDKRREALAAYEQTLECLKPQLESFPEPPRAILLAIRSLQQELGITPTPPKIDRQPGPLVEATLMAETEEGKSEPPFATTSSRFVFSWKADPAALKAPLQARWIAADVSGLAPGSLVAESTSEDGQTAGEFELERPEGGFVPGSYRLEIGMAGKRFYVLSFECQKSRQQ